MKIWLLTNTPSPYQVELLDAVGASGPYALTVNFLRAVHRGQPWAPKDAPSFAWRELRGRGPRVWSDAFRLHPEAVRDCRSGNFDVFILSGQYTSLTLLACAFALHRRGQPWALWLERPWPEDYRPAWSPNLSARIPLVGALRRLLLKILLRRAHRVLCIGSVAREAYRNLGVPEDRLDVVPYCCRAQRYESPDAGRVAEIRRRFGLTDPVIFLYSGQLIPRKGVDVLIQAFGRLAKEQSNVALLVLGDGPERAALEEQVRQNAANRVLFAGQVAQADLPSYFGAAQVFVFPSRYDGWGVVINEACAAGLPVISTRAVGAAADLVVDGVNGFLLDRDDEDGLYDRMKYFVSQPEQIAAFGARSKLMARKGSLEHGAAVFGEAARRTAETTRYPATRNQEPGTKNRP